MDRLRRLTKSKSSAKNDQGDQHVRQEKSKSKLPSSSSVAKLMGFDGLKSKKPIERQRSLQRTSPVALQGDAHLLDGESHKKRFTEQPECQEIFEDKFRSSGSNRDAILELLKKPNPLSVKHLQGMQESSSSSHCTHLTIPKQLNPEKYQAKDQNIERNTSKKGIGELSETTRTMKEKESKEAAKRFNAEVKEVFSRMRIDFPSIVKEIPGTGGLHDFSGIDSAIESDVMKMTSCDSTESFISRQAKKRLLERWRKVQRYEHARTGGKGSTLGEMLCTPEEKAKNLDAASARWDSPLGISSADGWKDKYSKIKPRSRSLPPPGTGNVKQNAEREYRTDDKLLKSKKDRYRSQSEGHGNFAEKKDLSSETSRSSKRKSQARHRRASNSYDLLENHINHDEIDLVKKVSLEEKPMVPPPPNVTGTIGTGASTTLVNLTVSSLSSYACYPDFSRSMLKQCDSSRGAQEHSNPKLLGAEAESSGSSKEADPGQISAPEVPSREDVSLGTECCKQVSTNLHDLRRQQSLLSRESKSSFDAGEGSSLALDANEIVVSECWEYFYIGDVLSECGLYDIDINTFLTECGLYDIDINTFLPSSNGPNHPLGPWVFHKLEKKYCDETSAPKHERMLLFDRIRSAILEISQSCMNQCPWVKPVTAEFGLKWPKCELRNELHKLLAIQDAEGMEVISGKVIDKVTYWGDLRNSVDMIGKIIERSVINDQLMELVMELQFDV